MKDFVVSDIHDHYDLLVDALKSKGFDINNKDHRLILCGDAFYSGPQPGELFEFLLDLSKKGKLILIYGNHDIELLDNLMAGSFSRKANRTCAELLVEHITSKTGLTDAELVEECEKIGFTKFLKTIPVWYYETDKYVFTHAFIPTVKNRYNPNWRNASEKEWRNAASRGDAMILSFKYGICEPNKIIVCGHYSAARCYLMCKASKDDWDKKIYKNVSTSTVPPEGFKPFYGDTFIALDQSVKKSKFINCIVLDN